MKLEPVTLEGKRTRLEPLSLEHVPALLEAANVERATYDLTLVPDSIPGMSAYVQTALDGFSRNTMLPFATLDARTNRVVGENICEGVCCELSLIHTVHQETVDMVCGIRRDRKCLVRSGISRLRCRRIYRAM